MDFLSERKISATRKDYVCVGCESKVEAGSPAMYLAGKVDGDFVSAHYHVECREAEVDWNRAKGAMGDEWESLWCLREDDEVEEWKAWLKDEHPAAFDRVFPLERERP